MFSIILVLLAAVSLVNGATIGVSDATTEMYASTMPDCSDKLDSCFDFSDGSCVGRYAPWARENCAYRCGYCPGNYPPCQDQITYCKELGSEVCNQKLYAGYVRLNCRETCNKCEIPALTYVPGNDTDVLPTDLVPTKPTGIKPTVILTNETMNETLVEQTTVGTPECGDKRDNCFNYGDEQCLGRYAPWAKDNCAYRCGYCPGHYPPCEDKIDYCQQLGSDACTDNQYAGFVRLNCRKTCDKCTVPALNYVTPNTTAVQTTALVPTKPNETKPPVVQTNETGCRDLKDNCWNYGDEKCLGIYSPWAKANCPYRCGYCPNTPPCVDKLPNCDEYGANVCTDSFYAGWSRMNCRKYCNKCEVPYHANITESTVATTNGMTTQGTGNATMTSPLTTKHITPPTVHTEEPNKLNTTTPAVLPTGDACTDTRDDCANYDDEACNGVFATWAMTNCARRCGYCTNELLCKDFVKCSNLPNNLCTAEEYKCIAETSCRKFCGLCSEKTTSYTTVVTTEEPTTSIQTSTVSELPTTMQPKTPQPVISTTLATTMITQVPTSQSTTFSTQAVTKSVSTTESITLSTAMRIPTKPSTSASSSVQTTTLRTNPPTNPPTPELTSERTKVTITEQKTPEPTKPSTQVPTKLSTPEPSKLTTPSTPEQTQSSTQEITKTSTAAPTKSSTPEPTKLTTPEPTKLSTSQPTKPSTPEPTKPTTPVPTKLTTPEPTKQSTPEPTKLTTPVPTKSTTPEPTKQSTPEPTKLTTPVPTKSTTPEPTKQSTPEPTKLTTPVPIKSTTPEPSKQSTPEPTKLSTLLPTQSSTLEPKKPSTPEQTQSFTSEQTTPEPINVSTPEPTKPSTPEPTKPSTPEPTNASTPEPTRSSTPEPTKPSTPEPTKPSTPEPTKSSTPEPTNSSTPEPTRPSTPEPTKPSTPEPTRQSTPEPTKPSTPEPTNASTPEPTRPSTPEPTTPEPKKPTPSPINPDYSKEQPTPSPTLPTLSLSSSGPKVCSTNFAEPVPTCCKVCACPGAQVFGRVINELGEPIPNAEISFSGCECVRYLTDPSGNYEILNICVEGHEMLYEHPGYMASKVLPVPVVPGGKFWKADNILRTKPIVPGLNVTQTVTG